MFQWSLGPLFEGGYFVAIISIHMTRGSRYRFRNCFAHSFNGWMDETRCGSRRCATDREPSPLPCEPNTAVKSETLFSKRGRRKKTHPKQKDSMPQEFRIGFGYVPRRRPPYREPAPIPPFSFHPLRPPPKHRPDGSHRPSFPLRYPFPSRTGGAGAAGGGGRGCADIAIHRGV